MTSAPCCAWNRWKPIPISLDIHLGNQRQPIFLLDRPGSHAAGFFAASTEADYLLKMQQALKGRIEQAKKDRKRLTAELVVIDRQLGQYEPLDDLEVRISRTEALYAAILETDRSLPRLEEIISLIQDTQAQLDLERGAAGILGWLEGPPALEDITGLTLVLAELEDKTRHHHFEAARRAALIDLTSPPALAATAELEAVTGPEPGHPNPPDHGPGPVPGPGGLNPAPGHG